MDIIAKTGIKMFRFLIVNKLFLGKTLFLILVGLLLSGCAVFFAIEFDVCHKCSKTKNHGIEEEIIGDSVKIYQNYGGGY